MTIRYQLFASREYLRQHGSPATTKDLDNHELIVYGDEFNSTFKNLDWVLELGCEPGKERTPAPRG